MEKIKIFILTEGSSKIGFGHITRCLAIYQAFEELKIIPKFIINGDKIVLDLVKNTNYEIFNWLENREKIFKLVDNADIVIIDSYLADKDFYEKISKIVKIPVYYDDNMRINYPKGIVINGNIHATELNYSTNKEIIYLLGTKYTPLRKEFWKVPEKEIKKNIESIMITFGGDDLRNLTPKILELLKENYPKIKKYVIIGKGFKNINKIKSMSDANTTLIFYPDANQMKNIMLEADIAISAGGQTLYELARVGVPTIAILVADNQMGNINGFLKFGIIKFAGEWNNGNMLVNISEFLEKFKDIKTLQLINRKMKNIIDGQGAFRITNALKDYKTKR